MQKNFKDFKIENFKGKGKGNKKNNKYVWKGKFWGGGGPTFIRDANIYTKDSKIENSKGKGSIYTHTCIYMYLVCML